MTARHRRPRRLAKYSVSDLHAMLLGFAMVPGYGWHIARIQAELRRREKAGRR